jgi:hypothetical protein
VVEKKKNLSQYAFGNIVLINNEPCHTGSRDSSVGIATGYGLDVRSRDSSVGIATGYGLDVRSRDSAVGIATGYGLDDGRSEFESP